MILVDTSVWINVLKDKTGRIVSAFRDRTSDDVIVFCRFIQLELLQGAKNEFEWQRLDAYLSTQYYIEARESTWRNSARVFFELRKSGITVRSPIDCCIACIAMEAQATLLHRDLNFEKIAGATRLTHEFFTADG